MNLPCCIPNNHTTTHLTFSGTTSSTPDKKCPKLLDLEHKLFNNNKGCVKYCYFFINRCAVNCLNDFPNHLTYHSLTKNNANCAKCTCGRGVTTMVPLNSIPSASSSFTEPILHPVAAILGMSCVQPCCICSPKCTPLHLTKY